MDGCGSRQSGYHFKTHPDPAQVPHYGLSAPIHHYRELKKTLQDYFLALPKPVLSDDDIKLALNRTYNPPSLIWRTWGKDPIKAAVLQAISSCWDRFGYGLSFGSDIAKALAQKPVCLLHFYSLEVEEVHYWNLFRFLWILRNWSITSLSWDPDIGRSPVNNLLAEGVPIQHHWPCKIDVFALSRWVLKWNRIPIYLGLSVTRKLLRTMYQIKPTHHK